MTRSTKFQQFMYPEKNGGITEVTLTSGTDGKRHFVNEGGYGIRLFELSDRAKSAAGSTKSPFAAKIKNGSGDGPVEIMLHDAIGDEWAGLDSSTLVKEIKASKGRPINLDINSFGGAAFDGIAIYNALAMHDAEVTATISGMAYSAASIIPLAADTIRIAENGDYGIHPAWLIGMGNQYEFTDMVDMLVTLDKQIVATYAARTGQTEEQITEWFIGKNNDGTLFSGPDAVTHGFADELIPLKKKPAKTSADASSKRNPSAELRERIAKLEQKNAAAQRMERLEEMRQKRTN